MKNFAFLSTAAATFVLVMSVAPTDAHACGGCFHEQPVSGSQTPSVITDHRMVLALGRDNTTLWDQVEYAGDPTGFAWVLPIRGGVVVGVSHDSFLDALDQRTAPVIKSPIRYCNSASGGGGGGDSVGCGGGASAGTSAKSSEDPSITTGYQEDSGVFITAASTVGPYQTVQIHGNDEGSIVAWLRAHRYVVPAEIEPILTRYVTEGFDFVAVRLRPGAGVRAMRPIRVTWSGRFPSLPLRMVAAGVGSHVGIKLFVIGDGRWRTANFPTFSVDPSTLTWDFSTQRSDYVATRNKMAQSFLGRAFALESSINLTSAIVPYELPEPSPDPGADTSPPKGPDAGSDAKTDGASDASDAGDDASDGSDASDGAFASDASDASDSSDSSDDAASDADAKADVPTYDGGAPPKVDPEATDAQLAFGPTYERRVTRLRADLPSKFLDTDLVLEADESQGVVSEELQLTKDRNFDSVCPQSATPASASNDSRGCGCELGDKESPRPLRASIGISMFALAAALVRRATRTRR